MRLTELSVQKLRFTGTQKTYFDNVVPGFGVRVGAKTKAYIVMYGKTRRLKTIGHYPHLPLSEARNRARSLLYAKTHSDAPTMPFSTARDAFLDECEGKNRHNTVRNYRLFLNRLDFNGNLDALTRQKIKSVADSPHSLTAFKVFLNWCVRNDYIPKNLLHGETTNYGNSRERVLTDTELKRIWSVLSDDRFSTIVRLLMLTGQRRSEVQHFQLEEDLVTIPAAFTKNKREHVFPVGTVTLQYLFLGQLQFQGWSKAKKRLDSQCAVTDWTLHDLRRTYATKHAELGTPIHVVERLLNHVSGTLAGVAGIYNRYSYIDEMREAVTNYELWFTETVLRA